MTAQPNIRNDSKISDKSIQNLSSNWKINLREAQVAYNYIQDGWKMLRNGAPDFLALRVDNEIIKKVKGVEVKSPYDDLSYEQDIYRKVFEKYGIDYTIEVVN